MGEPTTAEPTTAKPTAEETTVDETTEAEPTVEPTTQKPTTTKETTIAASEKPVAEDKNPATEATEDTTTTEEPVECKRVSCPDPNSQCTVVNNEITCPCKEPYEADANGVCICNTRLRPFQFGCDTGTD